MTAFKWRRNLRESLDGCWHVGTRTAQVSSVSISQIITSEHDRGYKKRPLLHTVSEVGVTRVYYPNMVFLLLMRFSSVLELTGPILVYSK